MGDYLSGAGAAGLKCMEIDSTLGQVDSLSFSHSILCTLAFNAKS